MINHSKLPKLVRPTVDICRYRNTCGVGAGGVVASCDFHPLLPADLGQGAAGVQGAGLRVPEDQALQGEGALCHCSNVLFLAALNKTVMLFTAIQCTAIAFTTITFTVINFTAINARQLTSP